MTTAEGPRVGCAAPYCQGWGALLPGSLTVTATFSTARSEPDAAFVCLAEGKRGCGPAAKFSTEGLRDPEQGPSRTSGPSPPTSRPRTWQAVSCPHHNPAWIMSLFPSHSAGSQGKIQIIGDDTQVETQTHPHTHKHTANQKFKLEIGRTSNSRCIVVNRTLSRKLRGPRAFRESSSCFFLFFFCSRCPNYTPLLICSHWLSLNLLEFRLLCRAGSLPLAEPR